MGYFLDELASLSADPRVPADERWDINQEQFNLLKSALDFPNLDELREDIALLMHDPFFVGKATRLFPYQVKAEADGEVTGRGHTSILRINEYGVADGSGRSRYVEKLNGFEFLRHVSQGVDMIAAFLFTFRRKILNYCQPERDNSPLGFHLVRCDGERLTDSDRKEVAELEEWIWNSGDEPDPRKRKRLGRDDMPGFVGKLSLDSLRYDACPIETECTRNGKLSGWYAVPGDTVRLCSEEGYDGDDEIFAVQLFEGTPHVAYRYEDLIYEVRNPSADLYINGYGTAEAETIVRVITGYLNAFSYNASGIDRSAIPRGILSIVGDYDRRALTAFRHQWDAMLMGATNRHKMPILASRDKEGRANVNWTPIDSFNEMFFAKFMTLCWSVAGAVFGMDPSEVHFESFAARNTSSLHGNDTEEKLAHSRIKGLLSQLSFFQRLYNTYLIPLRTKKYRLDWVGLHDEDEKRKENRILLTSTVDEVREMDGKEPHPDPIIGGAPVENPGLTGLYMRSLGLDDAGDDERDSGDNRQTGGDRGRGGSQRAGEKKDRQQARRQSEQRPATQARGEDRARASKRDGARVTKARTIGDFAVVIERDRPQGMDGYGG